MKILKDNVSIPDLAANLTATAVLLAFLVTYLSTQFAPVTLAAEVSTLHNRFDSKELDDLLFRIEELEDKIADLKSYLPEELSMREREKLAKFELRLERYLLKYRDLGGRR